MPHCPVSVLPTLLNARMAAQHLQQLSLGLSWDPWDPPLDHGVCAGGRLVRGHSSFMGRARSVFQLEPPAPGEVPGNKTNNAMGLPRRLVWLHPITNKGPAGAGADGSRFGWWSALKGSLPTVFDPHTQLAAVAQCDSYTEGGKRAWHCWWRRSSVTDH